MTIEDEWVDAPKTEPEPKPKRPVKRRSTHVTATQIAHNLGITPRVVRATLRALKVTKPQHGGWAWPPGEAKIVTARIAKRLKIEQEPVVLDNSPTLDNIFPIKDVA